MSVLACKPPPLISGKYAPRTIRIAGFDTVALPAHALGEIGHRMTENDQLLLGLEAEREVERARHHQMGAHGDPVSGNALARERLFERRDEPLTDAPPS